MGKRPFRPQQKGVQCSIEGCTNWCVSNDLCAKHNMSMHRYGYPLGKPGIKKICKNCGKRFRNKYERTEYCSPECYKATDEYKKKRVEAVRKWRKERSKI